MKLLRWLAAAAFLVGAVLLLVSSDQFLIVCPDPGMCYEVYPWTTLGPGLAAIALGVVLLLASLLRKPHP
jgi:hypothetical protein